jgi:hypothetical protein
MDEDLKARLYALPTRDELERIFSQFVTKEVFTLELARIREDIQNLQDKPETSRNKLLWVATIGVALIGIIGFLSQHIVLR